MANTQLGAWLLAIMVACASHLAAASGDGGVDADFEYDEHIRLSYGSPQEEAFQPSPHSKGKVFSWWEWEDDESVIHYVVLVVPGSHLTVETFDGITALHLHVGAPRGQNASNPINLKAAGEGSANIWSVKTPTGWPILAKGVLDDYFVAAHYAKAAEGALKLTTAKELWAIIAEGKAYFNLHTKTFPDGEIRGQIDWANVAGYVFDANHIAESLEKPDEPDEGEGGETGETGETGYGGTGGTGYDASWLSRHQDRYQQDRYTRDRGSQDYDRRDRLSHQDRFQQGRDQDRFQQGRDQQQDRIYYYPDRSRQDRGSQGQTWQDRVRYSADRYQQDRNQQDTGRYQDRFQQDTRPSFQDRVRQDAEARYQDRNQQDTGRYQDRFQQDTRPSFQDRVRQDAEARHQDRNQQDASRYERRDSGYRYQSRDHAFNG